MQLINALKGKKVTSHPIAPHTFIGINQATKSEDSTKPPSKLMQLIWMH